MWQEDVDARFNFAIKHGIKKGMISEGGNVVVVQGSAPGSGTTNMMKIMKAESTTN